MSKEMQKNHKQGCLTLIDGPMFANKTTTLIELIKACVSLNPSKPGAVAITVIKPTTDNRYPDAKNYLVSHDDLRYPASECEPDQLYKTLERQVTVQKPYAKLLKCKIFIDEGHFFKNLLESVQMCLNAGIDVVVSGINIDYKGNPFLEMKQLKELAKTHIACSAFCIECGLLARYTKMRPEIEHPTDSSVVIVGGSDKYAPYCGNEECLAWNTKK